MTVLFDIEGDDLLNPTQIFCIALAGKNDPYPMLFHGPAVQEAVCRLVAADEIVAHNGAMYDVPVIERLCGVKLPRLHDTLIWSKFLYPDMYDHPNGPKKPNSIEAWGRHFGLEKQEHTDWTKYSPEMGVRCCRDVEILRMLYRHLKPKVTGFDFPLKLEHQVARELHGQIIHGVRFDSDAAMRLLGQLATERAGIDDEFRLIFPPKPLQMKTKVKMIPFNPKSGRQFADRLREKYGWSPTTLTESGLICMDASVLKTLEFPEARLMERRQLLKGKIEDIEAYIKAATRDGRVHGWVNGIGAVTFRMSHSDPNLGNVPRVGSPYGAECRSLFLPSESKVLVGADLSGIELRLFANAMWEFDGGAYSELVVNGDPHTANQKAAGLETRQHAKNGIYCLMYGGGDAKLGKTVGKPGEGKEVRKRWMENIPAMKQTIDMCKRSAKDYGYVVLLDGRRAPVRSDYMALNTRIQGDAAVLHKLAMVLACHETRGRAQMLLNVHDELQFETTPEDATWVGETILSCMTRAGKILKVKTPIAGAFKVGHNWKETH